MIEIGLYLNLASKYTKEYRFVILWSCIFLGLSFQNIHFQSSPNIANGSVYSRVHQLRTHSQQQILHNTVQLNTLLMLQMHRMNEEEREKMCARRAGAKRLGSVETEGGESPHIRHKIIFTKIFLKLYLIVETKNTFIKPKLNCQVSICYFSGY